MIMKKDVYICSKPLQYFNIKNIGNVDNSGDVKILIVEDAFLNASNYVDKIRRYDNYWDEVLLKDDLRDVYRWLLNNRIHRLYVDNDMSWLIYCLSLFRRIDEVYVYEEGIGSYSNVREYEVASNKSGLFRRVFRRLLGMGLHFGDSVFCKGIYLTKPDLYNRRFNSTKGRPFEVSFLQNLQRNETLFLHMTGGLPDILDISGKKVLIYATEWEIPSDILYKFKEESANYDICYIKPHPHIKHIEMEETDNIKVLKTPVMLELILSYLLKRNNNITVWHQYSTSVVHFLDYIESVPFPIKPEYESVYKMYTTA